jgi:hypothetical protein
MGHKRADAETPQFFGGSKGYSGIQFQNLKDKQKNRQIGPIGYKGFKINPAIIEK